ncbi:hypothetical protein FOPG_12120 [Fusarium oxysporum f. sp. conglutinans race 2 54008]|uniref:Uncharacterized protein n=1 Tax=Fusarium oxysporum f. sp. conglutinans race 2 54008 TaxID=1089457 RepID=X0H8B7_FUSOX|nr:hypothetical protein FOPG_12120 [Fusarium oxysporum f. sp. conglutinans race 2 54008]KAG6993679.1 hypothetical protein FocnCong_v019533 [Fusarium oxysporum f. sp. conglutinans]
MGETLECHPFSGLVYSAGNGEKRPYQGALPNTRPIKTRSTRPCLCVSFLGMLRPMSIPHSEVKSGPSVASHTWTCPSILIHSPMNLFRCIRAPLTISVLAQGHTARSVVTAYWGCLCRCTWVPHLQVIGPGPSQVQYPAPGHAAMSTSDDEEVYETPHLSVPAS